MPYCILHKKTDGEAPTVRFEESEKSEDSEKPEKSKNFENSENPRNLNSILFPSHLTSSREIGV